MKADGEPLPMTGRKEELVNGFSRQCSSDQILHYAIQVYPGKKDGMKWWRPFQNLERCTSVDRFLASLLVK